MEWQKMVQTKNIPSPHHFCNGVSYNEWMKDWIQNEIPIIYPWQKCLIRPSKKKKKVSRPESPKTWGGRFLFIAILSIFVIFQTIGLSPLCFQWNGRVRPPFHLKSLYS